MYPSRSMIGKRLLRTRQDCDRSRVRVSLCSGIECTTIVHQPRDGTRVVFSLLFLSFLFKPIVRIWSSLYCTPQLFVAAARSSEGTLHRALLNSSPCSYLSATVLHDCAGQILCTTPHLPLVMALNLGWLPDHRQSIQQVSHRQPSDIQRFLY